MTDLYLSRIALRKDGSTQALAALLDPSSKTRTLDAHHRLLWSLFSDSPERSRDFLWRAEGTGKFLLLSHREPIDNHSLFELESQRFEPALVPGDRLRFSLRVNATVNRWQQSGTSKIRKRHDVVMDALRAGDSTDGPAETSRADRRDSITQAAAERWLGLQGKSRGFDVDELRVDSYMTQRLPRRGAADAKFGVLDLQGEISVLDPAAFLDALAQGFGKAKAFGNGLMLVMRA